jgi:hypothetical protein
MPGAVAAPVGFLTPQALKVLVVLVAVVEVAQTKWRRREEVEVALAKVAQQTRAVAVVLTPTLAM